MSPVAERKRTRLTPQARKTEILDAAAGLVLREGVSALAMERLARDCGVSKGLVHTYFATRDVLLGALLHREQADLRERGLAGALEAVSFEELIRQTTRIYLEQVRDRGALISALIADPSVARLMEEDSQRDRERTLRYFAKAVQREFGLGEAAARAVVDGFLDFTGGVGRHVATGALEVSEATEMCGRLIVGGLESLAQARGPARL